MSYLAGYLVKWGTREVLLDWYVVVWVLVCYIILFWADGRRSGSLAGSSCIAAVEEPRTH